jgi:hypothetical protein
MVGFCLRDICVDDGWLFRETPEYLAWNPKNARKRPSLRRKKGAFPFLSLLWLFAPA